MKKTVLLVRHGITPNAPAKMMRWFRRGFTSPTSTTTTTTSTSTTAVTLLHKSNNNLHFNISSSFQQPPLCTPDGHGVSTLSRPRLLRRHPCFTCHHHHYHCTASLSLSNNHNPHQQDHNDNVTTTRTTTAKQTNKQTTSTTTTEEDLKTSLFKNPIVQRLWVERQTVKQQQEQQQQQQQRGATTTKTTTTEEDLVKHGIQAKKTNTPSSSRVQVSYPFSTDSLLYETYRNPWGQIRLGKVLEDLDALAGNIAFFHVVHNNNNNNMEKNKSNNNNNNSSNNTKESATTTTNTKPKKGNKEERKSDQEEIVFPVIVTASVDRIRLRRRPLVGCDQLLSGQVTYVVLFFRFLFCPLFVFSFCFYLPTTKKVPFFCFLCLSLSQHALECFFSCLSRSSLVWFFHFSFIPHQPDGRDDPLWKLKCVARREPNKMMMMTVTNTTTI